MKKSIAVILAAGEGTRMKSAKSKVLQEVLFKPMLDWVAAAALEAGVEELCAVTGHLCEQVEAHIAGRYQTVRQLERLGTGHAVLQAEQFIQKNLPCDVVVLYGDAPFVGSELLWASHEAHTLANNGLTIVTAEAENPFGYGRIIRDEQGNAARVIEEKDATPEQKAIKEINSGIYWFDGQVLLDALKQIKNDNVKGEYYLTDTIEIVKRMGLKIGTVPAEMNNIAGANDRRQLMELNQLARRAVLDKLYDEGVSVIDEAGILIGPDVHIGRDTVILPGTIIRGETVIGEGCVIGPNSQIDSCIFGNNVVFNASMATQATVGNDVTVGPFAQLRPNSRLHDKVHIGDFVEVKNSEIGEGTKMGHLTYVGDADVGARVNFGCGVVVVNYDGVKKNRTTIGDDAFIGCNTNLVAPVKVGDNAYTGAGSTITKEVPANALAIERAQQVNKEGWVLRKRPSKSKN